MKIAIPLFDGFTALDAIGPYEVLSRLPGASVTWLAGEPGPGAHRQRHARARRPTPPTRTCPDPEIVVVPGGIGTRTLIWTTSACVGWIRRAHETSQWTTSVCTGSLLLGRRRRARRPRGHHPLARPRDARALRRAARPRARGRAGQGRHRGRRVVGHRHGADAGRADRRAEVAQAIQLGIEYDPQPPFDAGSEHKAAAGDRSSCCAALAAARAELIAPSGAARYLRHATTPDAGGALPMTRSLRRSCLPLALLAACAALRPVGFGAGARPGLEELRHRATRAATAPPT